MRKQNFLNKLKRQRKLEIVEPSENICLSYLEKAKNSFSSAKILLESKLYENSVSMSYYAMYNSLTALLFKIGIKCENHTGSILLLKELFQENKLFDIISFAKEERVDKQYYVDFELTEESAKDLLNKSEDFILEIKILMKKLTTEEIKRFRNIFVDYYENV